MPLAVMAKPDRATLAPVEIRLVFLECCPIKGYNLSVR